ncbi:predicted protein [Histoplasma capsulatum var. duboisii H88]|uniref:Predicted protein n=1 Tax=Ajellomyces capsulatus (strain H88) TaxID=544711 RepID=F0U4Y7_AJEC8|nr:predicted protein [Histoplasma capsulatum var. duboisii H88]
MEKTSPRKFTRTLLHQGGDGAPVLEHKDFGNLTISRHPLGIMGAEIPADAQDALASSSELASGWGRDYRICDWLYHGEARKLAHLCLSAPWDEAHKIQGN